MPVIGIPVDKLNNMLKMDLEIDDLLKKLTQIGCDIDAVTSLFRLKCEKCGHVEEFYTQDNPPKICSLCNIEWDGAGVSALEPVKVIRMELLPVRPDTFDSCGLARMLRGYLGKETGIPEYKVEKEKITVKVDPSVNSESCSRPHISCAVIRDITVDEEFVRLIMNLQENLHWALGRNRKWASIGVYDLDTIKPNISYTTVPLDESPFNPLGYPDTLMTPREILEKHNKGVEFACLLKNYTHCPVLKDSEGAVLSMPPIINSDGTKVGASTKNLFIDVTGLSERLVKKALNIITTSILEYFPSAVLEQVMIEYPDKVEITPNFSPEEIVIDPYRVNKLLGLKLSTEDITKHLLKMRYDVNKKGEKLSVLIPPFRNDIMHERDVIEDVAISYGYRNFSHTLPSTFTTGGEKAGEVEQRDVCSMMIGLGYLEVTTLILTNEEKNYLNILKEPLEDRVIIENPISSEQTMLRTEIFPGLLEIFQRNIHNELPQKIFEAGDVVFYTPPASKQPDSLSKETMRLAMAIMDSRSTFSLIKGEVKSYMRERNQECFFEKSEHPFFIKGRQANIFSGNVQLGFLGEVHPQVLSNFGLTQPVALAEVNI